MTAPAQWKKRGPTVFLEGQAIIDGVDIVAREMEARWGIGRLRLLVTPDLRARFDSQRLKLNTAIWSGDLDDLQREAARMINAWRALDQVATQAGCEQTPPAVFAETEVDGTLIIITHDGASLPREWATGRRAQVWSVSEVANVLRAFPAALKAKELWPGAEVVRTKPPTDPLLAVSSLASEADLEDSIPF